MVQAEWDEVDADVVKSTYRDIKASKVDRVVPVVGEVAVSTRVLGSSTQVQASSVHTKEAKVEM